MASQLLRLRGCPERLQRRLVAQIVEGDSRLAWLGRDLVGLAPSAWSRAELATTTFVVVDLETTGGSAQTEAITEIGAVKVRGGQVLGEFATLVDPGRSIPPQITMLTGISDSMVYAPRTSGPSCRLPRFHGQRVLVAHNAPFDLRFLNYERRRLAGRYFTQPWLDTLTLARRLLNGQVPPPRPRDPFGVGRHEACARCTGRCPTPRPRPRCCSPCSPCWTSAGIDSLERAVAFAGDPAGARHAPQAGPGRRPPGPARRVPDARPRWRRALRREGDEPAPSRALVLRPRRTPWAAHRAGARGARVAGPRDLRVGVRRAPQGGPAHQGAAAARATGAASGEAARTSSSRSPRTPRASMRCGPSRPDGAAYFGPVAPSASPARRSSPLRLLYGVEGGRHGAGRRRCAAPAVRGARVARRPGPAAGDGGARGAPRRRARFPHCPAAALLARVLGGLARARRAQGSPGGPARARGRRRAASRRSSSRPGWSATRPR